jgi:ring-1,2-phenylacetyl-CoA epoxidase subunit PaaE
MSTHFTPLKVKDIRKETNDCVSVSFEIEEASRADFAYHPGQYITMRTNINNEEVRRSYSICSAPHEEELRVAIKQVPQGLFSTYANSTLKVGDTIELMAPLGHFVIPEGVTDGNFYGFASGSGITPVMSIMKHVLANKPKSTFTLVYGNKNMGSIIFKEQIDALKNIYMERLNVVHILSREHLDVDLHYGRISKEKCTDLFTKLLDVKNIDAAFICGPEEMTMQVKDFLIESGVPAKHVKFELFGTNIVKKDIAETKIDQGLTRKVSIKVDSRTITFEVAEGGENILDAALKNGADLPYACKGGVCCTCRAKVVEGEVRMDVNYALEQDEVDAGFVLTCQAHPVSEHVVIDFDVR